VSAPAFQHTGVSKQVLRSAVEHHRLSGRPRYWSSSERRSARRAELAEFREALAGVVHKRVTRLSKTCEEERRSNAGGQLVTGAVGGDGDITVEDIVLVIIQVHLANIEDNTDLNVFTGANCDSPAIATVASEDVIV